MPTHASAACTAAPRCRLASHAEVRFAVGALAIEGLRITLLTDARRRGRGTGSVIGTSLLGHYAAEPGYDRSRLILQEPATFSPGRG